MEWAPLLGSAAVAAIITMIGNRILEVYRWNKEVDREDNKAHLEYQEWFRGELLEHFKPFASSIPAFIDSFEDYCLSPDRLKRPDPYVARLLKAQRALVDQLNQLKILVGTQSQVSGFIDNFRSATEQAIELTQQLSQDEVLCKESICNQYIGRIIDAQDNLGTAVSNKIAKRPAPILKKSKLADFDRIKLFGRNSG
ncbi:hypothetical protein [Kocuria rosea]|uniref:hypothetical protein n=1 Tax=Kocuria rosea TaxID=1275 RepID=UPI00111029DC|nr:hypothetical protein [Kocuria rosea]QCY32636.1 hypothetical protein EQG70_06855 [Kocuria rosea]